MEKNHTLDESNSELCSQCQSFKFSTTTFCSSPFQEKLMHQLGFLSEVSLRTKCSFCQFIIRSFRAGPITFADYDGSSIQGSWREIVRGSPNACLSIWLVPRLNNEYFRFDIRLVARDDEPAIGRGRLIYGPLSMPNWSGSGFTFAKRHTAAIVQKALSLLPALCL